MPWRSSQHNRLFAAAIMGTLQLVNCAQSFNKASYSELLTGWDVRIANSMEQTGAEVRRLSGEMLHLRICRRLMLCKQSASKLTRQTTQVGAVQRLASGCQKIAQSARWAKHSKRFATLQGCSWQRFTLHVATSTPVWAEIWMLTHGFAQGKQLFWLATLHRAPLSLAPCRTRHVRMHRSKERSLT